MGLKTLAALKWIGFSILSFAFLVGCGGGGGSADTSTRASSETSAAGIISGTATKGPVSGATMSAFAINADGTKGAQIGSAQTDGHGNFSMNMVNHSGPIMLQMMGGTYMDEATGSAMTMDGDDRLTCVIPNVPAGATLTGIQVTPLTSMAQMMVQNMSGGMNERNAAQANTSVGRYFNVSDILATRPMDPTANGSGASATTDMRNYGMTLGGMSQYARDAGMTHSSGMVTAMMNDASDMRMDGMMSGGMAGGMMGTGNGPVQMGGGMMSGTTMAPNAGTRGLAEAMGRFINSPMNRSGVTMTHMQELMDKLSNSNGQIQ